MTSEDAVGKLFVAELEARVAAQKKSRAKIQNAKPLDEVALRGLDSALKKTTAFMKKIRNIAAGQQDSFITDLNKVNLSRFVEEIAQAIAEVKLKISDLATVVEVCVEIACRYEKFAPQLIVELKKGLPAKKTDKVTNPGKLRVDLRLVTELFLCGVLPAREALSALGNAIAFLVHTDSKEFAHLPILLPTLKAAGRDLGEFVPLSVKKHIQGVELPPLTDLIRPEQRKTFAELLTNYHSSLVQQAQELRMDVNRVVRKIKKFERNRGDALQEDKQDLETCRAKFEKIAAQGAELSEVLGLPFPDLPEEPSDDEEDEAAAIQMAEAVSEGRLSLWPDEETRRFYQMIKDIRRSAPAALFKESSLEQEARDEEAKQDVERINDVDVDGLQVQVEDSEQLDEEEAEDEEEEGTEDEDDREEVEGEETEKPISLQQTSLQHSLLFDIPQEGSAEARAYWAAFQEKLPTLVNRDLVDDAALDFLLNLNSKPNRRRLVRALFLSGRNRLDLLPFLARLVATLDPVMPDIAKELGQLLHEEFKQILKANANRKTHYGIRLEAKIKCVVFMAELMKFGILPKADMLQVLRQLVYDFRGHSVDMVCAALEAGGLFLYRSVDSHAKMKVLLEVIQKKKQRLKDSRHLILVENAYYSCVPLETEGISRHPPEPPINRFIRMLVQTCNEVTVDKHLRLLRRINWTDETLADLAVDCLSSAWRVSFSQLPFLASMVSGLKGIAALEWVTDEVVDNVAEHIRLSLEVRGGELNQAGLASAAYLGELYNYNVCDSGLVFKTLYLFLTFPLREDSTWRDLSRLRLIATLVTTVAEFFASGNAKRRMETFLNYYFKYYWMKKEEWKTCTNEELGEPRPFPAEIEGAMTELLAAFRGKVKLPVNYEDAKEKVAEMEVQLREKLAQLSLDSNGVMSAVAAEEDDGEEENMRRSGAQEHELYGITEEEEDDEAEEDAGDEDEAVERRLLGIAEEDEEEEDVKVHQERKVVQPEDEDFMKELDRMLGDTYKSTAPIIAQGPIQELIVPAAARQRFQRKICFDESTSGKKSTKQETAAEQPRIALLVRGKNNRAELRAVAMQDEQLEKTWEAEREQHRREQQRLKHLTLEMSKRQQMEEEDAKTN